MIDTVCVNREELAWAAGFFDGEGNVNMYATSRISIQLKVTQIHRATLERFRQTVGVGVIYGPYITKTGRSPQWTFKVHTFEAVQAITAKLWPWLTPVKREQAAKALEGYRLRWVPRTRYTPEERIEARRASGRAWAERNREAVNARRRTGRPMGRPRAVH